MQFTCGALRNTYDILDTRASIQSSTKKILAPFRPLKKKLLNTADDNEPVVFELTTVSNYRRKSLIENNIPFITDKQVFLPFIGTMLSDEKEPQKLTGSLCYSTQQLFLFYLYSKKNDCILQKPEKCFVYSNDLDQSSEAVGNDRFVSCSKRRC